MLSYDPIKGQGIAEITAYSDMEDGPHTVFINSKYAYFVGNALFIEIRTIPDSEEILEEDIKDVEDNEKHLQQINFIKNAKAEEDLKIYRVKLTSEYDRLYKPRNSN